MEFGKLENFLTLLSVGHERSNQLDRFVDFNFEAISNTICLNCIMVNLNYADILAEAGIIIVKKKKH